MHCSIILIFCFTIITGVLSATPNCSKPPPEVNPIKIRQCCNGPPLEAVMKEEYAKQCKDSIKSYNENKPAPPAPSSPTDSKDSTSKDTTKPPPRNMGPYTCAAECMINQANIFVDGKYNKANAETFLKKVLKDEDFTSILESVMADCAAKATDMLKKSQGDNNSGCNALSGIFLRCVNQESANKCPDSRWLQSTNCNNVRSFIKSCGIPSNNKQ